MRRVLALMCLTVVAGHQDQPINIPLAPYNVKLFCRTGPVYQQNLIHRLRPLQCPTASTSCGYFEFQTERSKVGVFECVDPSVFMSEQDEEIGSGVNFARLCSHKPMCHAMPLIHLNRQFLVYIAAAHQINISNLPKFFKFCCALNHNLLNRLIQTGQKALPIPTNKISCENQSCDDGAVGCLVHHRTTTGPSETDYDYFDIKPVQIFWEGQEVPTEDKVQKIDEPSTQSFCVYPHLNDELYRYCLMIYNQKARDLCWTHNGHTVCCCFVKPDESTCALPQMNTTTTTPTTQVQTTSTTTWPSGALSPTESLESMPSIITTTQSSQLVPTITQTATKSVESNLATTTKSTRRKYTTPGSRRRFKDSSDGRRPKCRKKYEPQSRFQSKSGQAGVRLVWECDKDNNNAGTAVEFHLNTVIMSLLVSVCSRFC